MGSSKETTASTKMFTSSIITLLVFSSAATLAKTENDKEGRVEAVDKSCPSNAPCTAYSSCPSAMDMFLELSKMERKEYMSLASAIQANVCNKKEKGVCCNSEVGSDCVMSKKGYAEGDKIAWTPGFDVRCKHGKMVLQARQWQEVFRENRVDTP